MITFITVLLHFSVSYLHGLLCYRFFSQRNQSDSIYAFWWCMLLWTIMHNLYGVEMVLESLEIVNIYFYYLTFVSYFLLPFASALMIPLFISELTIAPQNSNVMAKLLLPIAKNGQKLLLLAIVVCFAHLFWNFIYRHPMEQWIQHGNLNALYGLSILGFLWSIMLLSGIRPKTANNKEAARAMRIIFAFILLLNGSIYVYDVYEYWSLIPLTTTVMFSLTFSWYRYRLQFMDMIINQLVRLLLLIVGVSGLIQLTTLSEFLDIPQGQYFLITLYLIATLFLYRFTNDMFNRLWLVSDKVLASIHNEFPQHLASCRTEEEAIKRAEDFIQVAFKCNITINKVPRFDIHNHIVIPGIVEIDIKTGYIRGWVPWMSQANSRLKIAGIYLQSHIQIQRNYAALIENEALSSLAARAELNTLKAQIKPHFLFNTLNSIHSFVQEEPKQAEYMIEQLSELMRNIISSPDEDTVTLEKELHLVENYLAIEKVRYGERLSVSINIKPNSLTCKIPSFSIQPLVENVIKHAVDDQIEPVKLSLFAYLEDSFLIVKVVDDGPGLIESCQSTFRSESKSHDKSLGLAIVNIRERIARLFGSDANLIIENGEHSGVIAQMKLPQRDSCTNEYL